MIIGKTIGKMKAKKGGGGGGENLLAVPCKNNHKIFISVVFKYS